jgi:anti-anti-sigma regulatory factor
LSQRPRVLVADLSKVDFFASAGLAALVDAQRKAGESVLFGSSRPVTQHFVPWSSPD